MLSYELTLDDHVAYNEWLVSLARKQQGMSTAFLTYLGICGSILGILLVLLGLPISVLLGSGFFFFGITALLAGPLSPLVMRRRRQQWKEALQKQESLQKYHGVRTVAIEADGLRSSGPTGERMIRWGAMTHATTPTLDIFHVSPYDVIVIPRHAFRSEQQREGFLAEIERRRLGEAPLTTTTTPPVTGAWWTQGATTVDDEHQPNTLRH
ncbi:MAG: YcxB family protein [Armatimonas sp.]